jgi:competence protein ComGC
MSTVIISLIIAALIALNIRYIVKQKRKGKCIGCEGCQKSKQRATPACDLRKFSK